MDRLPIAISFAVFERYRFAANRTAWKRGRVWHCRCVDSMTPTSGPHACENWGQGSEWSNLTERKPRPQRCMFDSEQFQAPLCATAMLEFSAIRKLGWLLSEDPQR
jgi:hypothetical protein